MLVWCRHRLGSAVNVADVSAGDTVVVVGTGGIGVNAVQGATMAGAANVIAVDPIEMKREFAQTMGATHAVAIEEATPSRNCPGGGANQVIITVGDATSDLFAPAMGMVGKGGSLTLTSLSNAMQNDISLNTVDFAMSGKHLHGSIYGYCNPRRHPEAPASLRPGKLKLDELVTQKYALEDINEGYQAAHDGEIIRPHRLLPVAGSGADIGDYPARHGSHPKHHRTGQDLLGRAPEGP